MKSVIKFQNVTLTSECINHTFEITDMSVFQTPKQCNGANNGSKYSPNNIIVDYITYSYLMIDKENLHVILFLRYFFGTLCIANCLKLENTFTYLPHMSLFSLLSIKSYAIIIWYKKLTLINTIFTLDIPANC